MVRQEFILVLIEGMPNFYEATAPELPKFRAEVTGSGWWEALDRAQRALAAWVARQRELGEDIPPGRGRGYVIYGDGAKPTENMSYWSKADIRRITGLSRATIDRRISDGTLKTKRCGRRVLFVPSQVRAALSMKSIKLDPI